MKIECKKCDSLVDVKVRKIYDEQNKVELVCGVCGKYIKWANGAEILTLKKEGQLRMGEGLSKKNKTVRNWLLEALEARDDKKVQSLIDALVKKYGEKAGSRLVLILDEETKK